MGFVRSALAAVLLLLHPLPASAQDTLPRDPAVASAIGAEFGRYDAPYTAGFMVTIVDKGQVAHVQSLGRANREFDIPWTYDTRYRLASWSKTLLAQATFALEAEGRLTLDDPVTRHVPDAPSYMSSITLRHLITMMSGLRQDELLANLAGQKGFVTLDELWGLVRQQGRLDYAPGRYQLYTDSNSRLLTLVLERVTGLDYGQIMQRYVFGPSGMTNSLTAAYYREVTDGQGSTYIARPGHVPWRREVAHPSTGDGGVVSTMRDAVAWLNHVTRVRASDGLTMFDRFTAPVRAPDGRSLSYRYGSAVTEFDGLRISGFGHGGASGTLWAYFPEQDVGILIFKNAEDGMDQSDVAGRILRAYLGKSAVADAPRPKKAAKLPPAGLFFDPATGESLHSFVRNGRPWISRSGLELSASANGRGGWILRNSYREEEAVTLSAGSCGGTGSALILHGYLGSDQTCYVPERPAEPGPVPSGLFFSHELGTAARIELGADGGIALRLGPGIGFNHYGSTNVPMVRSSSLTWRSADLAMKVVSEAGSVSGFYLSTDGARLVWFGRTGDPAPQPAP